MLKFIGTVLYVIAVIIVVQVIIGGTVWLVSKACELYLRREEQKQYDKAAGIITVRASNVRTHTSK